VRDSQSIYPILLNDDEKKTEARPIVHHSIQAATLPLEKGNGNLIEKKTGSEC